MLEGVLDSANTIAVILGSDSWPHTDLKGGKSCGNAAREFERYLYDRYYFDLNTDRVLRLFSSEKSPAAQIELMGEFIDKFVNLEDLVIYYAGHGTFADTSNDFYLVLKSTKLDVLRSTAMSITALAEVLRSKAPRVRRYMILDCCFSGAALRGFMSEPLEVAVRKTVAALPAFGTLLFCSSSHEEPSLAPSGQVFPMFSGALFGVLKDGMAGVGPGLSFNLIRDQVHYILKQNYPNPIRPVVHCDQINGDLASLPLLRNKAFDAMTADLTKVESGNLKFRGANRFSYNARIRWRILVWAISSICALLSAQSVFNWMTYDPAKTIKLIFPYRGIDFDANHGFLEIRDRYKFELETMRILFDQNPDIKVSFTSYGRDGYGGTAIQNSRNCLESVYAEFTGGKPEVLTSDDVDDGRISQHIRTGEDKANPTPGYHDKDICWVIFEAQ